MSLDSTAIGITISIVGCVLFASLEFYKRKEFEISHIVLVFLAIFAILGGVEMIYAALVGDSKNLPSSWREYLGVAGMAGIGLSLNYVISAVKKVMAIPTPSKKSKQVSD
ncbi:hypothetical protein CXF80_01390 [Shewanella sp. Actino-trap-3]|jgi:FtsH-binding integral membrane protein|uniref:hypothetical protein n=1 Tax=Shewanella sp. Actino-trap-3 TaxID=2058331 RepID=UPI000C31FE82|nr:hypothetical protein [Shewanella sp. Actino-trap-3]PKG77083.1 hypothetical protein CXF80_01390 [Shewanella sp. Actino-trap-3]